MSSPYETTDHQPMTGEHSHNHAHLDGVHYHAHTHSADNTHDTTVHHGALEERPGRVGQEGQNVSARFRGPAQNYYGSPSQIYDTRNG